MWITINSQQGVTAKAPDALLSTHTRTDAWKLQLSTKQCQSMC